MRRYSASHSPHSPLSLGLRTNIEALRIENAALHEENKLLRSRLETRRKVTRNLKFGNKCGPKKKPFKKVELA